MYSLKKLLFEGVINKKKPFSLSKSDPYMYYWETTGQQDNPAKGVWMSKQKNVNASDDAWYDLSTTLSPSQYAAANKKLHTLPSTAYQLDWSGESNFDSVNAAAAVDAKKNTDILNKRLKAYNDELGSKNKKIDISKMKPIEAGATSQFNPKILTTLPSGWMQIEIPWGAAKKKTKFWTRSKWFTNGSYNYKDGDRSYKVYWMSPK